MLYDRKLDQAENKNIVADVNYKEVLKEMRKALKSKQEKATSYQ